MNFSLKWNLFAGLAKMQALFFLLRDAQKNSLFRVRFRTLRYSRPQKIC